MATKLLWTGITLFAVGTVSSALPFAMLGVIVMVIGDIALWFNK